MAIQYSLIRFVPDTARGEFVNVGAIAGDDTSSEWELRVVSNLRRAKAIDDRGVLAKAMAYVASFEDHISDNLELVGTAQPMSSALLRQRANDLHNVVQLTAPAPVAADSAEQALDIVFEQLVLDSGRRSFPFQKKHSAVAATRRAYKEHDELRTAVRERAPVVSGVFDETFDFAVHNGRAVQLVQCWSFQLPNQAELAEQIRAWSWLVHELRKDGGELRLGDVSLEVPPDLAVFSVIIPPLEGQLAAFEEAEVAFRENRVRKLTVDDARIVGDEAVGALVHGE